jgi:hypothetical protein
MTCWACLHDNEAWAQFCADCGRGLNEQLPNPSHITMGVWSDRDRRCGRCDGLIPARTRFCARCGTTAGESGTLRSADWVVGALVTGMLAITSFAMMLFQHRPD